VTTAAAFAAHHEKLRIGILMTLDGVGWPVASVLLHFGHVDPYPILDYRALEALGVDEPPQYTFDFWWSYVEACRTLATKHRVDADLRSCTLAMVERTTLTAAAGRHETAVFPTPRFSRLALQERFAAAGPRGSQS
jgi:hypothetical protein